MLGFSVRFMAAERTERGKITEEIPHFTIPFSENGNFDPTELDKFAEGFKNKNDKSSRLRLHWAATTTKIFFFPETISHTRFYRFLERVGEETELRATGVYDVYSTPRERYLYGNPPLALAWILSVRQSEKFRTGTLREIFGEKFHYYKS